MSDERLTEGNQQLNPINLVNLPDGRVVEIPMPEALKPLAEFLGEEEVVLSWYQGLVVEEMLRRESSLRHKIKRIPTDLRQEWGRVQVQRLHQKIIETREKKHRQIGELNRKKTERLQGVVEGVKRNERRIEIEAETAKNLIEMREKEINRIEEGTKLLMDKGQSVGVNIAKMVQVGSYSGITGLFMGLNWLQFGAEWGAKALVIGGVLIVSEIFWAGCELAVVVVGSLRKVDLDILWEDRKSLWLKRNEVRDWCGARMNEANRHLGVQIRESLIETRQKIENYARRHK